MALVGFLLMMIADALFGVTDLIINKGIPSALVVKLLLLKIPAILVLAFPISTLFATLLSLGRLSRDNEIISIRMGRISFYRIMLPFVIFGIIVSFTAYYINEKIVPWTNHSSENILRRLILQQAIPLIQENIFFKGGPDKFFYVKRYDKMNSLLEGILIYETSSYFYPRVLTARSAKWEGSRWRLLDGAIHKFSEDGHLQYEAKFSSLIVNIDFNPVDFFGNQKTPQEMSRQELLEQIKIFERGGIDTRRLSTDYYFKFSIPFACLIFVLIGAPLSVRWGKAGTVMGVILSIVLVFIYYILMSVSRSFGFNGLLHPFFAAWSQNILFGVVAIYLVWKVEH